MHILILNSSKYQITPFDKWLEETKGLNLTITLLTKSENIIDYSEKLSKEVFKLVEVKEWNEANLLNAALHIDKQKRITKVLNFSESGVLIAYQIKKRLNLFENQNYDGQVFRNKIAMKDCAAKSNIILPKYQKINSENDIHNFLNVQGYPVVIKPIDGIGSVNTFLLKNDNELNEIKDKIIYSSYVIEEYIEGDVYHIDGLIDNGEIKCIIPSKYGVKCIEYTKKSICSSQLNEQEQYYNELVLYTKKIVASFPFELTSTFHLEVFIKPNGEIVFCEVGARTGGAFVNNASALKLIDLNQSLFRASIGLPYALTPSNKVYGWVQCNPKIGIVEETLEEIPFDFVTYYEKYIESGDVVSENKNCVFANVAILVEGDDSHEVFNRLNAAESYVDSCYKYYDSKVDII